MIFDGRMFITEKTVYEFRDSASGGEYKTDYDYIYVSAYSEDEAYDKFKGNLDLDPHHATCDCCGSDFSIDEAYEIETEGKILFIE